MLSKASYVKIRIWVNFINVLLEHWNPESFCHIASTVGRLLHIDGPTYAKSRIFFICVCDEVDASGLLVD